MAYVEEIKDSLLSTVGRIAGQPARQYRWSSLRKQARFAIRARRYQEAAAHLRDALQVARSAWPEGPRQSETAIQLADVCAVLDRDGEAESLYRDALLSRGAAADQIDDVFVRGVSGLGRLYLLRGEPDKAEPLIRRALDLETVRLGPGFASVTALFNMALLHAGAGRDEDAKRRFGEAIETLERSDGAEPLEAIAVYDNCALFCISRGLADEAESLFRRALIIRQETVGPRHSVYAAGLVNLGRLQFDRDALDEAESLLWQATDVYQRNKGTLYAGYLPALYYLALIARRNERRDEAGALCKKLLVAAEGNEDANGPAEAALLHVFGLLQTDRKNPGDGEQMFRRADDLARSAAPKHRRFASNILGYMLDDLAVLVRGDGKTAEADALCAHAKEIRETISWSLGRRVFTGG